MPIYRATIAGRNKPVLVKADSAAQAAAQLVTLETLSAAEVVDLVGSETPIFKAGDELPADDAE